jgi:hypothetical protein
MVGQEMADIDAVLQLHAGRDVPGRSAKVDRGLSCT